MLSRFHVDHAAPAADDFTIGVYLYSELVGVASKVPT